MIFKKLVALICGLVLTLFAFTACQNNAGSGIVGGNGGLPSGGQSGYSDGESSITPDDASEIPVDETGHEFTLVSSENGTFTYACSSCEKTAVFTVEYLSGTQSAYTVDGNTLSFTEITEDSEYSLSGEFYGNIIVDTGDDYKFGLTLNGFSITSYSDCPVYAASGDKFTLSAKKDTENFVYDLRQTVGEGEISASVYALCDLNLQGKGSLFIKSTANNGVHTKDDLKVKNLTLQVECEDNALKGNDSVTIESGNITLIARSGDGIKTTNSDISSKGKQRGTVAITGGEVTIYAALDGIDAAYDVTVDESSSTVTLKIYTDKYSEFTAASDSTQTANASTYASRAGGFPGGVGPGGNFGGQGGKPGDQGGMPGGDGNSQKSDYSAKGIKADNQITVSAGEVVVKSYDDALHANSDETLENGETSLGGVTVSGGTLTLFSGDDAIHADGKATVSGGTINIVGCYEGVEGATVEITGGDVSVASTDDGLNGTATSGASIVISGGTLFVYAGGDGVDSNSTDSYGGIVFGDGKSVIISTGQADSAIDTEHGYTFNDGFVLAIGLRGGMSGETTNCKNFSIVGKTTNLALAANSYLTVDGVVTVKIPSAINAAAVTLGATSASVAVSTSSAATFGENGVCWL